MMTVDDVLISCNITQCNISHINCFIIVISHDFLLRLSGFSFFIHLRETILTECYSEDNCTSLRLRLLCEIPHILSSFLCDCGAFEKSEIYLLWLRVTRCVVVLPHSILLYALELNMWSSSLVSTRVVQ